MRPRLVEKKGKRPLLPSRHADRARTCAEKNPPTRSAESPANRRMSPADRAVCRDAAHPRRHRKGRPIRRQRSDYRRKRHRKRTGRTGIACRLCPSKPTDRDYQRRRRLGRGVRKRAVRPREGRLHRRQAGSDRPLRDGRRQHTVPRRNRKSRSVNSRNSPLLDGGVRGLGSSTTARHSALIRDQCDSTRKCGGRFRQDRCVRPIRSNRLAAAGSSRDIALWANHFLRPSRPLPETADRSTIRYPLCGYRAATCVSRSLLLTVGPMAMDDEFASRSALRSDASPAADD